MTNPHLKVKTAAKPPAIRQAPMARRSNLQTLSLQILATAPTALVSLRARPIWMNCGVTSIASYRSS